MIFILWLKSFDDFILRKFLNSDFVTKYLTIVTEIIVNLNQ